MRFHLSALALSVLLLSACGEGRPATTAPADTTGGAAANPPATPATPRQQCFLETLNRDTTSASLTFDGNQVSGRFYWLPYEKDRALGSLSGTRQGDTLVATYDYMIEGSKQHEEMIMLLRQDSLLIFSGELEDRGGKLTIKDRSKMTVRHRMHSADCTQVQIPE